ncbi:polysaccharide biosynthesis/export family protein [Candidatus Omnitrophota bacterium]
MKIQRLYSYIYTCRKALTYAFLILTALHLLPVSSSAITTVGGSGERYYTVKVPGEARVGKPFTVVVKVYNEKDRLIQDYNRIGNDVAVIATGNGTISPKVIPASSFKHGKAIVDLTYDKAETFDIIITPIERKTHKTSYVIGQQDTLEISVWEAEGLTKDVIVAPDGSISFPLVGELRAAGKTLTELDKEVTEKIAEYVREPQVSIMVKKLGGKRVVVFGEVKNPGVYNVLGEGTLMEVIAMAGGFGEDAITGSVVVVRGDLSADPDTRVLNLVHAVKKGRLSREYIIEPNDIVYVPERLIPSAQFLIKKVLPGLLSSVSQEVVVERWLKDSIYVPDPDRASTVTVN